MTTSPIVSMRDEEVVDLIDFDAFAASFWLNEISVFSDEEIVLTLLPACWVSVFAAAASPVFVRARIRVCCAAYGAAAARIALTAAASVADKPPAANVPICFVNVAWSAATDASTDRCTAASPRYTIPLSRAPC